MCDVCVAAVSIFCKDINIYGMTHSFICVMYVWLQWVFAAKISTSMAWLIHSYVWCMCGCSEYIRQKWQHSWHDSFIHMCDVYVAAVRILGKNDNIYGITNLFMCVWCMCGCSEYFLQNCNLSRTIPWIQHTATHCNTLQHTATHCNTLQHTATHGNTL